MMVTLNPAWSPDVYMPSSEGFWATQRQLVIAELVHEYDPYLELRFIPKDKRTNPNDPPYAIFHSLPGRPEYVVFKFTEEEFDDRILARLYLADGQKHDVADRVEARNKAAENTQRKLHADQLGEHHDFFAAVMGSPLHTFRHKKEKYQ